MRNYKFCFDGWALLLFLIVMLPNFLWFFVPAPNDVLRAESVTGAVDTIASICQVLLVAALCILRNQNCGRLRFTPLLSGALLCVFLYFLSWAFYYRGIVTAAVLLGLTLPPCLAFLFFALARKNYIAAIPISLFTVCHMIYAFANFIFK